LFYLWNSKRVAERDMVDEPHTLILSDSRARYCLDFTHSMNWSLRKASVEVLKEGIGRLRKVAMSYRPGEQRRSYCLYSMHLHQLLRDQGPELVQVVRLGCGY
jgi:alpha-galactosidase